MSTWATSRWPPCAAMYSAVLPACASRDAAARARVVGARALSARPPGADGGAAKRALSLTASGFFQFTLTPLAMNSFTTSASPFSAAYQSFLRFSSCRADDASHPGTAGAAGRARASRTVSSSEGGFLASFLGGISSGRRPARPRVLARFWLLEQ